MGLQPLTVECWMSCFGGSATVESTVGLVNPDAKVCTDISA